MRRFAPLLPHTLLMALLIVESDPAGGARNNAHLFQYPPKHIELFLFFFTQEF